MQGGFTPPLRRATAKPNDMQRFDEQNYGTFDDPIGALAWTAEGAGLPIRNPVKIGRNDPCPCGSGKKYKKCCLKRGVTEITAAPKQQDVSIQRLV